jgi:hypothetical protein
LALHGDPAAKPVAIVLVVPPDAGITVSFDVLQESAEAPPPTGRRADLTSSQAAPSRRSRSGARAPLLCFWRCSETQAPS